MIIFVVFERLGGNLISRVLGFQSHGLGLAALHVGASCKWDRYLSLDAGSRLESLEMRVVNI